MESVLITGCSNGGIGSALAVCFAQHGHRVFATARDVKNMSELETFANIRCIELDILNPDQIKAVVGIVREETGGNLTYLVNNAGQNRFMPLLDESIDNARELFDLNVWGHLRMTQEFAPLLMAANGTVAFITSVSGYINVPWQGAYAASKSALETMADTLRLELAPFNVKVVSIVTTAVKSRVHTHYTSWKMPEGSVYVRVESDFTKRAKGDDGAPRMETMDYANGVVSKILKGSCQKFWYGASASLIKTAILWLPLSWLDSGMARGTGIDLMIKDRTH